MVKFSPEAKNDSVYFEEGVHEVQISDIKYGKTDSDKEYVEISVVGKNKETSSARLWFTTQKASDYAFKILKSIFVHNAPQASKDAMRDKINLIDDSEDIIKLLPTLKGKSCWFELYRSDRQYVGADGNPRNSYDKNVYGYEPKPKDKSASTLLAGAETVSDLGEIPF